MPIPFLNSINLTKNQVENFCIYNLGSDPTGSLTASGDYGYFWLNTAGQKTLKWWDGANIRSIIDSTNIGSFTSGLATDLAGGAGGDIPYQVGTNDTGFLSLGSAGQVLAVKSTLTQPEWINQSSMSVGSATNKTGGNLGDILVQGGSGTTGFLNVGTAGQVITSNGASPQYVDQSTLSVGSATTAGSVTNSLTAGTYLTSGGTYNGSVARTFAVDATDANTASKVVARDASGNFAAGTITAAKVTGLSAPTAGSDAANRDYVDSVAQGLDVKASCKAATVSNINLASPGATIDTVSLSVDNRVLVKDQSAPAENGIYLWKGAAVAMVRSPDADTWDDLVGAFTFVEEGTAANADSGWVCSVNAGGTLGSTAVTWVKFSQAGSYTQGRGMVLDGTAFNFAQNTDYTAGRIPFASGPTTIGFNANLHWDNGNNRLGIGTATPTVPLDVVGAASVSGVLTVSTGTAAAPAISFAGDATTGIYAGATSRISFSTAGSLRAYISPNGIFSAATGTAAAPCISQTGDTNTGLYFPAADTLGLVTGGSERLRIASDGVCTWSNVGGVVSNAMVLNGTGLGIGASPSTNLHIYGAAPRAMIENSANNGIYLRLKRPNKEYIVALDINNNGGNDFTIWDNTAAASRLTIDNVGNVGIGTATPNQKFVSAGPRSYFAGDGALYAIGVGSTTARTAANEVYYIGATNSATPDLVFTNAYAVEGMRITHSGNLGLGVTPTATWDAANGRALQLNGGSIYSYSTSQLNVLQNAFFDGSAFKYVNAAAASGYRQISGAHSWYVAASGSAGASIGGGTWSAAMTLDASGFLGIGMAAVAPLSVRNSSGGFLFNFDRNSGAKLRLECDTDAAATGALLYVVNSAASAYQPLRIDASVIRLKPNGVEALTVKTNGQTRFVPLASAPASPERGDVYYDSTTERLRYYNNTAWVDSGTRKYVVQLSDGSVTVAGNAYTLTHNFGTQDVTVSIRRTTDNAVVQADVVMPAGGNTVTVTFAAAITAAQFYVTVIG